MRGTALLRHGTVAEGCKPTYAQVQTTEPATRSSPAPTTLPVVCPGTAMVMAMVMAIVKEKEKGLGWRRGRRAQRPIWRAIDNVTGKPPTMAWRRHSSIIFW